MTVVASRLAVSDGDGCSVAVTALLRASVCLSESRS